MPAWTPETKAAVAAADWRYTRRWLAAMREFDRARTLPEVIARYNAVMPRARAAWDDEVRAALAVDEDPF